MTTIGQSSNEGEINIQGPVYNKYQLKSGLKYLQ